MDYRASNSKKIDSLFSRVQKAVFDAAAPTATEVLHYAAVLAIDSHDNDDLHPHNYGHYAWVAQSKGEVVGGEVYDGEGGFANDYSANSTLAKNKVSSDLSEALVDGYVIAQMSGAYYKEGKEVEILEDVIDYTADKVEGAFRQNFRKAIR